MKMYKIRILWEDKIIYKYINGGFVIVELTTKEVLKKKILDVQELIRDYEKQSKKVDNMEVADLFKEYAEECGFQAQNLQKLLKKIDGKNNQN